MPAANPLPLDTADMRDRAVELAKGCSECRQCVERCPYDLEIPDMLKENIRFYESFSAR